METRLKTRWFGKVLAATATLAVAILLALAVTPAKVSYAASSGNSDWMGDIDDSIYVTHLSIPGTHQSAAWAPFGTTNYYAKCQSADINGQLSAGIRAFDLRYAFSDSTGTWWLWHGSQSWAYELCQYGQKANHMDIGKIFDWMQAWLNAHPSEFLIVNIQCEYGNKYTDTQYKNLLARYGATAANNYTDGLIMPYWVVQNAWQNKKVGDLRGRIIDGSSFLQGVGGDYNDWDAAFNTKVQQLNRCFDNSPSVQRTLSTYSTNYISQQVIYSNLACNAGVGSNFFKFKSPEHYAGEMRKYVFQYNVFTNGTKNGTTYNNRGQKAYGIVLYDYPTQQQAIIDYNVQANDWAKKYNYTVAFNTGGAVQVITTQTIQDGKGVDYPWKSLTKVGYTFKGWYTAASGGSLWTFATNGGNTSDPIGQVNSSNYSKVTANTTLYAHWEINKYSLRYELNGGSYKSGESNPSTYTYGDTITKFAEPTRVGYTFDGWYKDANFTTKVTNISSTTLGDMTLYAKWNVNTYKITYVSDVTSYTNSNPTSFVYGSETITLTTPSKQGYLFLGWEDNSGNVVTTINTNNASDVVLVSKWKERVYDITYVNVTEDEKKANNLPSQFSYETETTLPLFERDDYLLEGWYEDAQFSVKADTIAKGTDGAVTRYAKWVPKVFDITYELGAITTDHEDATLEPSVKQYTYGVGLDQLETPSKYGYTFVGWYSDAAYTAGNEVTSIAPTEKGNKTLYAKWSSRINKITFIDGFNNPNPTTFAFEDGIVLQPATRDGYTFDCWSATPNMVAFKIDKIAPNQTGGDITLYGIWKPITYNIKYKKVDPETKTQTDLTNTGNPTTYACGTGVASFNNPTETLSNKYRFYGWCTNPDDLSTKVTNISTETFGDQTLYAIWTDAVEYTITYDLSGGNEPAQANPKLYLKGYGVKSFNDPIKENYDFVGWFDENDAQVTSISAEHHGNITLKAKWQPKVFNITFDTAGGEEIDSRTYTYGTDAEALPTAVREHYTFDGWFKDDKTKVGSITSIDCGDFALTAHWTPKTYKITYISDGQEVTTTGNPAEYTFGEKEIVLTGITKDNYGFAGWYSGDTKVDKITKDMGGDLRLEARFVAGLYKITYDYQVEGNPETYIFGQTTEIPNAPVREGYDFKGWQLGDSTITEISSTQSGDISLVAVWEAKSYSITYVGVEGATNDNPDTYKHTVGLTLGNPTRDNYDFVGWYQGDVKVTTIEATSIGDITLEAKWSAHTFNITYDYNGGNAGYGENPDKYTYGVGIETFIAPSKDKFDFEGWKINGEGAVVNSISATQSGDVKLVAQWTDAVYEIEYELYGGHIDGGNPTHYTYGQETQITVKPTKTNYTFNGWIVGDKFFSKDETAVIEAGKSGKIRVYADWQAVEYKITYDYSGGSEGKQNVNWTDSQGNVTTVEITNPKTYTYGEGEITLIDPVPEEDSVKTKFKGWYLNDEKVTTISATQSGDITLKAKWGREIPIVTLTAVSGSGDVKVNGSTLSVGQTKDIDDGNALTVSWNPKSTNNSNISIIKSIKINGVDQGAFAKIDKTKWQTTNTEYQRRMNDTSDAKIVTYENILAQTQSVTLESATLASSDVDEYTVEVEFEEVTPVYRMYNMITSEHLFTTNKAEYDNFNALSATNSDYWICEGIDWLAPASTTNATTTTKQVYRLYNAALGAMGHSSHYYTSDEAEMKNLVENYGWTEDTGNGFMTGGDYAIYTCYNEALGSAHHYTSSKTEWESLASHGWDLERDKNGYGKTGVFSAKLSTK